MEEWLTLKQKKMRISTMNDTHCPTIYFYVFPLSLSPLFLCFMWCEQYGLRQNSVHSRQNEIWSVRLAIKKNGRTWKRAQKISAYCCKMLQYHRKITDEQHSAAACNYKIRSSIALRDRQMLDSNDWFSQAELHPNRIGNFECDQWQSIASSNNSCFILVSLLY